MGGEMIYIIIATLQNTASNPVYQSVEYCIRNLYRASACLQISSFSFTLCQIACLHYLIDLL